MNTPPPLGYASALRVIELGRAAFFGSSDFDLPESRTAQVAEDDRTPQFGYVGANYTKRRVLFLGINPGNGLREGRNAGDEAVMPTLHAFRDDTTAANFLKAQRRYEEVCSGWRLWGMECQEVLADSGLGASDIAFTNALPFRAGSVAAFPRFVAESAARHYVAHYIAELQPKLVLSLGKRAAEMVAIAGGVGSADHIVWNRARALTSSVKAEREAALTQLKLVLSAHAA